MEKFLGYKPKPEVEEHFIHFVHVYVKQSDMVLHLHIDMEFKVVELQHFKHNHKCSTDS